MQFRLQSMATKAPRFLKTSATTAALLWLLHAILHRVPISATSSASPQRQTPCARGECLTKCTPNDSRPEEDDPNDSAVIAYTANYDEVASAINIVGATALQLYTRQEYCHVWSDKDGSEYTVPAEVISVLSVRQNEHHGLLTVHRCWYPSYQHDVHTEIAIARSESCRKQTGRGIPVHGRGLLARQRIVQFAVCCLPEWDTRTMTIDPENFISFIETNYFFGAGKFYFYNMTTSTSMMNQVLAYYKSKDLVEVVQWPANSTDLFTLKAARQDCLHRSKAEAEYAVYLSVHDVLVPADGKTWRDIIRRTLPTRPAAYQITSVLFGVPSPSPCQMRNRTLTRVAARVKSLQYTLFSGVDSADGSDRRFYRMMYDLDKVRSHPSLRDDWLASNDSATDATGQLVARVDASAASIKNFDGRAILVTPDRNLRVQPLKHSPSLCQHTSLILESILRSCASCAS